MKKLFYNLLFLFLSTIAVAQTTVTVQNFSFTPADITVTVGETVTWDCISGFHNVNGSQATYPSNPEDFANGAAAAAPWDFSHTFNTVGTYDYRCDPHFGSGMVGTVTVEEAPAPTNAMLIAGVYDAQPSSSGAKGMELYVLQDIPDLSIFGLGSANNGGGSDGQEFTFPAVPATAGDCIYVTDDSTKFADFFGFNADFVEGSGAGTATGINGDDAIELFENGTVIDVFGDINMDGTGEPWEHTDGWAYRLDGTGPDGSTFNVDNWIFSGVDALQDVPTNADATSPFPNCSYSAVPGITNALVIAGVYDAQPGAAGAKGWELYALQDIPDLSVFGLGAANNGGGTDSIEFTFPAVSAMAGDCIYVTDDSTKFADFFGFNANFVEGSGASTATGINGDDALELFENGIVIDVFGDINTDGTGEAWEYLDGWAYRKDATGPDGNVFNIDNWTFSGVDGLQGFPTNAEAPVPFPNCSYSPVPPAVLDANDDMATTSPNTIVNIDVLNNDDLPNGWETINILDAADNGFTNIQLDGIINYNPVTDFCGDDSFSYIVCDINSCDTATVSIDVICPPSYPAYTIAEVTTVDANGLPDSIGMTCQLQGIVHGVDLQGNDNIQFTFIDATGGISLFSSNNFGYTVQEGDEVIVQGTISQFNGLSQITPDTLWMVSAGNPLVTPLDVTELNESTESEMIRITNLSFVDPSDWDGMGSGFNVDVTDGVNTYVMRIDNDVDLYSMPFPGYALFNATGIGGQFDSSQPHDQGYQFLPRYMEDLEEIVSVVDPFIGEKVKFYPNPADQTLNIESQIALDVVTVSDVLGQPVFQIKNPQALETLNVDDLVPGVYIITFLNNEKTWSAQFVKQ